MGSLGHILPNWIYIPRYVYRAQAGSSSGARGTARPHRRGGHRLRGWYTTRQPPAVRSRRRRSHATKGSTRPCKDVVYISGQQWDIMDRALVTASKPQVKVKHITVEQAPGQGQTHHCRAKPQEPGGAERRGNRGQVPGKISGPWQDLWWKRELCTRWRTTRRTRATSSA
jgi:hypothetical protein